MSDTSTGEAGDDVARCLLLTHEAPPVHELTPGQVLGTACVWCQAPARPARPLIDLGATGSARPHACPRCYRVRLAVVETYRAWLQHTDTCTTRPPARCRQGERLARAHDKARHAMGKPPWVRCLHCGCPAALAQHGIAPSPGAGEAEDAYLLYIHTGPCPTRLDASTRYCDHCGRPIEGEPQEIIPESPTGAAPTVYVHPYPCRPPVPRQTTPSGWGA